MEAKRPPTSLTLPIETKVPSQAYPMSAPESYGTAEPAFKWRLEMLLIPPELAQEDPDAIRSMTYLLDPSIAKSFATPIILGKPGQMPPLYGQLLVMISRSELIGNMGKLVTSLLEPGLTLAKDRLITDETAPGLLLTWMYLNGFIGDYLSLQLRQGQWGLWLLNQPYDCLWTLEWCRYFVVDETEDFFKAIEQRLIDSLAGVISEASEQYDKLVTAGRAQPINIMANWTPSQRQTIIDGYKRYHGRCMVDGSELICDIAHYLWQLQQPWQPELPLPNDLQLALEYYKLGSRDLADRLYRSMMMRHVPTPEERKWFIRYFQVMSRPRQYFGFPIDDERKFYSNRLGLIETVASYLGVPVPEQAERKYLGVPPEVKPPVNGRADADFYPDYQLAPGTTLPYVTEPISSRFRPGVVWPSEQELLALCASKSRTSIKTMSKVQLLGYLVALKGILDIDLLGQKTSQQLRQLLIDELNKSCPMSAGPIGSIISA